MPMPSNALVPKEVYKPSTGPPERSGTPGLLPTQFGQVLYNRRKICSFKRPCSITTSQVPTKSLEIIPMALLNANVRNTVSTVEHGRKIKKFELLLQHFCKETQ